jgi:hypothetical protein
VHRFYVPDFPADGDVQLPEDEAQLSRVLRLSAGDTIVASTVADAKRSRA